MLKLGEIFKMRRVDLLMETNNEELMEWIKLVLCSVD